MTDVIEPWNWYKRCEKYYFGSLYLFPVFFFFLNKQKSFHEQLFFGFAYLKHDMPFTLHTTLNVVFISKNCFSFKVLRTVQVWEVFTLARYIVKITPLGKRRQNSVTIMIYVISWNKVQIVDFVKPFYSITFESYFFTLTNFFREITCNAVWGITEFYYNGVCWQKYREIIFFLDRKSYA